jgi:hypothetical protein
LVYCQKIDKPQVEVTVDSRIFGDFSLYAVERIGWTISDPESYCHRSPSTTSILSVPELCRMSGNELAHISPPLASLWFAITLLGTADSSCRLAIRKIDKASTIFGIFTVVAG